MIPSTHEYLFMARDSEGLSTEEIYRAGDECHQAGWIDEFGIVTAKGQRAIYDYEKANYR